MNDHAQAVHAPKTKLVSMNCSGNLHDAVRFVNECGWSDFFMHADSPSGSNSIVILRLPIDWPRDSWGPLKAKAAP